jgi:hypothetical protein
MSSIWEQHEAVSFRVRQGQRYPRAQSFCCAHATAASVRMHTRLYTAAANVNIQPIRAMPRWLSLRSSPTVFSQPKISSTHFRFRWLTA